MKECPICKTNNKEIAQFCKHCGLQFIKKDSMENDEIIEKKIICSKCKHLNQIDSKFCSQCGNTLLEIKEITEAKSENIEYEEIETNNQETEIPNTKYNVDIDVEDFMGLKEKFQNLHSKDVDKTNKLPDFVVKALNIDQTRDYFTERIIKKRSTERLEESLPNVELTESEYEWEILIGILVKGSLINANNSLDFVTSKLQSFCRKYLPQIKKDKLNLYINLSLRNNNNLFKMLEIYKKLFPKKNIIKMLTLLLRILHIDFLYSQHDRKLEEQIRIYFGISKIKFIELKKSALTLNRI